MLLKTCHVICSITRIKIVASKNKLADKEIIYTNTPLFLGNISSNLPAQFSPKFTPKTKNKNQVQKTSSNAQSLLKYTLKHEFEQKKIANNQQISLNGKTAQSIKEIARSFSGMNKIDNKALSGPKKDNEIDHDEDLEIPNEGPEGYNPYKVSIYGKGEITYKVFEPGSSNYKLIPSFKIQSKNNIILETKMNQKRKGTDPSKNNSRHQSNEFSNLSPTEMKKNNKYNQIESFKEANDHSLSQFYFQNKAIVPSKEDPISEEFKTTMNIEGSTLNSTNQSPEKVKQKENQSFNLANIN